jgi:hypothetical protein
MLSFKSTSADRDVVERCAFHLIGAIDVAEIDNDRLGHEGFEPEKIQGAELLPFGRNHHRIRAFGRAIGAIFGDDQPMGDWDLSCALTRLGPTKIDRPRHL